MILYFSGTGNSLKVAQTLAEQLHQRMFCMEQPANEMPHMEEDEALGLVFPIYAWGIPRIVEHFLKTLRPSQHYIWTVMTCGDDMGFADHVLERSLGRQIDAAFSVQMPNTYVCLPGFDVDAQEVAEKKIVETHRRLPEIAQSIAHCKRTRQLHRGLIPWTKTYILRPLFDRFLVTDRYFRSTQNCTSCGRCAKDCPLRTISLVDGHPQWAHKGTCTGCLRCYHRCPHRAIEWGRYTRGKGQSFLN